MPSFERLPLGTPTIGYLRFGLAVLILNTIPALPALLTPLPLSPYFPLCVESLVIATALALAGGTSAEAPARVGALIGTAGLVLYEAYDAMVYSAFQRSGILYEDVQFLDNLAYLVVDVASWRIGGLALLGAGAITGLAVLVSWAVRVAAADGRRVGSRWALAAGHLIAWPLVLGIGPAYDWGTPNLTYQQSGDQVRFRTIATKAAANLDASLRLDAMLDSLENANERSPYAAYDSISLQRRPSVYLFSVESYGSVLAEHPALQNPYPRVLARSDSILQAAGWYTASARLEAPVRGGRSWLSIASLMTGVHVHRQLLFNRFKQSPGDIPHLVRFFKRQGYHTVALQPFTFARPGLPVENLYGFDSTIYRSDLEYQGPPYGLANAPDQYSLQFAHERAIAPADQPVLFFFETVSSHALWNYGLAPDLSDWRAFNEVTGPVWKQKRRLRRRGGSPTPLLPDSVTAPRIFDQPPARRYLQHISYDLHVIRDYLRTSAPPGSLVLILGDHQPPLLDTESGVVPLHVLSTDSTLVKPVLDHGFREGLRLTGDRPALTHAGIYSFLVHLLTTSGMDRDEDSRSGVRVRPRGADPGAIVQ